MEPRDAFDVQRLGARDLNLMAALLTLFGEVFEMPETYCAARPDRSYMERLLGSDDFITLVARKAGRVVGGLTAYVLRKFEQERSEVYIYDLAVDAAHRRQGIATALIKAVKPIARDCGAYVIVIQADQGDEPPIALYSKLGKREEVLHFDIDVE